MSWAMTGLYVVHYLAACIVLAEALNKLERTAPFAPGMEARERVVDGLKALAWILLAMGAGGALVSPVLAAAGIPVGVIGPAADFIQQAAEPDASDTAVLVGFAVLIIRTRVKEG